MLRELELKRDAAITTYMQSQINDMIYLAVNDYIDIRVFHNQRSCCKYI